MEMWRHNLNEISDWMTDLMTEESRVFEASACSESIKIREIEHKYLNKYIIVFLNNFRYFNRKYIFFKYGFFTDFT